jgi:hypothetical protein
MDMALEVFAKNPHDRIPCRIVARDLLHGNMITVAHGKPP